jgi:thiamine biosynthesis lipoprotein
MAADLLPGTHSVQHARFRSMGSEAHVVVVDGPASLVARARTRLGQLEASWSRFIPTSEISTCNDLAGTPVPVSAETALLIDTAIEGWHLSAGRFDPTVLGDVLRAGYEVTFERLHDPLDGPRPAAPMLRQGCGEIEIERHFDGTAVITLRDGVGFDPGGVGKGLAADLVADELMAAGAGGACVNVGGDLAVRGLGPHGGGWTITIDGPGVDDAPLTSVALARGAVATSTTARRRWNTAGGTRHHLIDPLTGEPSTSDVAQVTVIAATAWSAEVLAKASLLRGRRGVFDLLDDRAHAGLAVTDDGAVLATPSLRRFTDGEAAIRIHGTGEAA